MKMGGWKTWTGIGIGSIGALLEFLSKCGIERVEGYAKIVLEVGGIFGVWGIAHKVEKAAKGISETVSKLMKR